MTLTEIQRRQSRCYLEVLNRADMLYCEGGESLARGLQLFDDEGPSIRLGQEHAARLAERDKEAAWCKAIILHNEQVALALELGDQRSQAQALGNLGRNYLFLGDYKRALECHEQDLQIVRRIGDRSGEARVLGNLATTYYKTGEHIKAVEFYQKSLAIALEIGDPQSVGNSHYGLCLTFICLGDLDQAFSHAEESAKKT
jgi:tetratricopeptide (TPR) repeat protein